MFVFIIFIFYNIYMVNYTEVVMFVTRVISLIKIINKLKSD